MTEATTTLTRAESLQGRAMLFIDTDYAGSLIDDGHGITIFSSTAGKMKYGGVDDENGFFTKALIEGLRGKAADIEDNLVYPSGLGRYVTRRVQELSNNEQRPVFSHRGTNEPIFFSKPP